MIGIIQLRIQLADIGLDIWRRIAVPATLTLTELHAVIQGAMGWQDSHLHMFEINGQRYEIPEYDTSGPQEPGVFDERNYILGDIVSRGTTFDYIYDFGDDWRHTVTVEDIRKAEDRSHAACIAGERACPPEDCGGSYGYPDFLDALDNPDHPRHEEMVEWAGGFKPEEFDIAQANTRIAAVCAHYRERGWGFGGQ